MPFIDYLIHPEFLPNSGIVRALDSNNFPNSENKLFINNAPMLGGKEFNRCVEYYLEKTPNAGMNELSNVMEELLLKEENNEEVLENLAIKIVREMYDIPEGILMKSNIGPSEVDFDANSYKGKELSEKEKKSLQEHIQKRVILNCISHGGAVYQWTSAFHIANEELNEINEDLISLYERYAALINYYNWQHNMALIPEFTFNMLFANNMGITQGSNKVTHKNKPNETTPKGEIDAYGINFPVLIHELSKGALDYLLSIGIPNHLSEDELKYIYSEADKYQHEFWHYYMGPTLWEAILTCADVESQELPRILSYMAKLDYDDLSDLCIDLVNNNNTDNKGKLQMKKIKQIINSKTQ